MEYTTTDLYLTSYLNYKQYSFETKKEKSRIFFIFKKDENLNKDVNEFLMGRGSCEPLLFTNSIKNIKSFILNS